MKFVEIISEVNAARNAGYQFDKTAETGIDKVLYNKLVSDQRRSVAEKAIDMLYDFDGSLYQGDDGCMYAVQMVFDSDEFKPLCWHRLTKMQ